jgi:hypothetical protein
MSLVPGEKGVTTHPSSNMRLYHIYSINAISVSIHFVIHCNEYPIYVFPEQELHGLSPNFHIHVSVSD